MSKIIQYEQQIAGALLINQSWHQYVELQPADFLDETSAMIFEEIGRCHAENMATDVFIIADRLQNRTGQNYENLCLNLASKALPTEESLKTYAGAVKKQAGIRKAQAIMHDALNGLLEGNDSAIDLAISELMAIDKGQDKYEWTMHEAVKVAVEQIDYAYNNKDGGLIGLPTGLEDINQKMGGLHRSDLIIIGARPAMGKTAVMLNLMIGSGVRCGVFSSEQGHDQIAQRAIAITGGVPVHAMRTGQLNDDHWSALMAGTKLLVDTNCIINDNPVITIQDIQRQSRKWVRQDGVQMIFVDYAQRVRSVNNHRDLLTLMGEVIPSLKSLARELNIPVVVLAQVKREVESRSDKRPLMGDLSDASIMEKEADQIIMLYRDEVYNPDTELKGVIELLYEKNRHGPTGKICASWQGETLRIRNLSPDSFKPQQ